MVTSSQNTKVYSLSHTHTHYSVSSSYQDLMPQFLRAIRMLCSLYKHYVEALKTETQTTRQSPTTLSTPSSPSPHFAAGSHSPSVASVRRAGSFGSILDSPDLSRGGHGRGSGGGGGGGGRLGRRFGHRRSHSQSTNPDNSPTTTTRENRSQTLAVAPASPTTPQRTGSGNSNRRKRSREASFSISDPFEQLETVWNSLESWFELLMTEVAKLQATETTSAQAMIISKNRGNKSAQKQEIEPQVCAQTPKEALPKRPSESEQNTRKPQLALPTIQSSRLAAAIVKSAPIDRRAAFLRPSSSFDHSSPSLSSEASGPSVVMDKRRSWHMEQLFTTRYLASGGSLSSIPSFQRSLSSETNLGECELCV